MAISMATFNFKDIVAKFFDILVFCLCHFCVSGIKYQAISKM